MLVAPYEEAVFGLDFEQMFHGGGGDITHHGAHNHIAAIENALRYSGFPSLETVREVCERDLSSTTHA